MTIGERIKNLRESRGLTLEQVGSFVGVNKATVQRYETGEIDIKRSVAIRLGEIFNVSPAYLMGWTDVPYIHDEKKAAPADGDGLSPLDAQLMDLLRFLTDDQKKLLLAQIETLLKSQQ